MAVSRKVQVRAHVEVALDEFLAAVAVTAGGGAEGHTAEACVQANGPAADPRAPTAAAAAAAAAAVVVSPQVVLQLFGHSVHQAHHAADDNCPAHCMCPP